MVNKMTRKEKEKLILDSLGLKTGDKVKITYNRERNEIVELEIIEYENCYGLEQGNERKAELHALIYLDFEKIIPKKKIGELTCAECNCEKCIVPSLVCNKMSKYDTLYAGFESAREDELLNDKVYSLFRKVLDEEIE